MSKNVILYCRVSSDEQALNTSLKVQEERLRDYCLRYQFNVVDCYKEEASAKTFKKRPEMQKLMTYCRSHAKKVDEILFLRWDRYSRNLEYALTNMRQLKNLGITVNSIDNPLDPNSPDFPTLLGIYVGNAESENNKISKRTKDGIIGSREMANVPTTPHVGIRM
jgi:DNA invertase Pin-like site-specific DNA recombinase